MTVYLIAEVKVTDPAWIPDYAAKVHNIAAKFNGRYLSRSGNIETLEGEKTDETLIALIEFPSREDALGFAGAAEYAPFARARQAGRLCQPFPPDRRHRSCGRDPLSRQGGLSRQGRADSLCAA